MDMGTHDYGRAEEQRATARRATVPTLDSLKATSDMVTTPTGATMPAKLAARGEEGWEFDADRDSEKAAKLADLVKDMDRSVVAWLADSMATCEEAERIMGLWLDIRKITKGGQS